MSVKLPEEDLITDISDRLSVLDTTPLGESLSMYADIEKTLKNLEIHIDRKYLFQCDLQRNFKPLLLDRNRIKEISEGLQFINKISFPRLNSSINLFIEKFQKRYDSAEISLLEALDEKIGIGYKESFKDNFLLNDISFPLQETKRYIEWGLYEKELSDKYINSLKTGQHILLTDKDFKTFTSNWEDLPSTISVFCEIYQDDFVLFEFAGNSSAANLISRFGHYQEVRECLSEISNMEESLAGDSILAEIVHIPFSRTGNVLQRPRFRNYEIPYLSNSFATRILISDLMISVKNGEILLRSKKYNKRVIPILSTAHNFNLDSSLPIYNFLSSIQTQNQRACFSFTWGGLEGIYNYYPRVQYKNIIFSLAQWLVSIDEFETIIHTVDKPNVNLSIKEWRAKRDVPRYVQFCQGDNKLFLDLDSLISVDIFLSELNKIKIVILQEYPRVDHKSIIETDKDCFNNQFIFSFHK